MGAGLGLRGVEEFPAEPEARWRMNLDVLRRASDDLAGWPAEALMPGAFAGPMLVLYGGTSDYVTDAGRAAFAHWFPQAELHAIPDTGHCSSAATSASWARSSARSTSRVIRVRAPTRRADSARHVAITTPVAPEGSSYVVPAGTWPA